MMARVTVLHMSAILAGLMLSVAYVSRAADLIEPTRTLGGTEEPTGKLVVFSEPPGYLPHWMVQVSAIHRPLSLR